jgi:putative NADH-flavin reductase
MHVALIGATGPVGQRVSTELLIRGHSVTAISTHPERMPEAENVTAVRGDINEAQVMAELLRGHEVVVSCVQFAKFDHEALIEAVRTSQVARYFVCGGSGTLFAPGTTTRLMDTPTFPEDFLPPARAAAAFFDRLRDEHDLHWTYISPPPGFAPGERTGVFRVGGDEVLVGPDGEARISYEDYAVAVIDELERPQHRGRFTVGY